jgi:pSer/pThr/pTyr-binding forkhead associated (FHA) protein
MRHRLAAARWTPRARRAGDVPVLVLPSPSAVPPGTQLLLGRSRAAAIRFADPTVSRRHAVLHRLDDDRWLLTDLASTHGTRINGRRIATAATLNDGDRLQLGRCTHVVIRT